MKKYKHFLALGASTLALGLAHAGYAAENHNSITLNDQSVLNLSSDNIFHEKIKNDINIVDSTFTNDEHFIKENPNYLPEKNEILAQEKEIKQGMQETVFQAVKAGFIKFHELPTTYKIHVVEGFSSIMEDSHYDSTDNSLQLSFVPQTEVKKVPANANQEHSVEFYNLPQDIQDSAIEADKQLVDEIHSKTLNNEFTYGFANDQILSKQVGTYNQRLINQFIFLHELSHSVNHHAEGEKNSDSIYAYKKTNDNLSQDEMKAFSNYTSDTLDENFADGYGGIMFLKLNHFSPESINTLKQIATMRNYTAQTVNKSFYNDSVEAHYSYYTLENVLNNIEQIKHTDNQKDLIELARNFSSNGTYQAYQNYGKAHNNSFSEEKQRDIVELATQYLYNEVNKDKNGFIPLQIDKAKYGNTYYSDLSNLDKEAIKFWANNEVIKMHSLFGSSDIAKSLDIKYVKSDDVVKTFNLIKEIQPTDDAEQLQRIKESTPYVFLKSKIIAKNDFDKTNMPTIYQNIMNDILKYENQQMTSQNKIKEIIPTLNLSTSANSKINSAINSSNVNNDITHTNANLDNKESYSASQLLPILDNIDKQLGNKKVSTYIINNQNVTNAHDNLDDLTNKEVNDNNVINKIKALREKKEVLSNETIQTQHTSTINGAEGNYKMSIKDKRKSLGFSNETDEQKNKDNIAQTLKASFVN
jgi:hypothetical protein